MKNKYIITTKGHYDLEGFEGTWAELVDYVKDYYTQDELCCVKEFHNTNNSFDWEDLK